MSENSEPLSRRRVLRAAVIGTGAAVAATALPTRQAMAAPKFTGDVVLGAIPVTFVGAPLGLQGATHWEVTKHRTDTLTLRATADQSLSISFDQTVSGTAFGIGLSGTTSQTFKQATSVSVANAATIRSTESMKLTSQAGLGSDGYATPGDTTFYLIARPKINLFGNPSNGFRFKFLKADFIVIANLRQLLHDPSTRDLVGGPATADNIAALYPFRDGSTSGAALPTSKFKFRKTISAGPSTSTYGFKNELASGSTVSAGVSEQFAIEIKESFGFDNNEDPLTSVNLKQKFGAGQSFQVTVNATQEQTNMTILTTSGELFNDRERRLNNEYKVKAFKTIILSDEGLPRPDRPPVASGRVLDGNGNPVAGVVGLINGSTSIETTSDRATGNFTLHSTTTLPPGNYPVVCGDAVLSVPLGGSATLEPTPGTERQPINPILIES